MTGSSAPRARPGVAARSPADRIVRRRAVRRLGLQAAAIVAAIVAVLTTIAVVVVVDSQRRAADLTLTTALARADDVGDPPANTYLTIRGTGGTATTAGSPAGLPDSAALDRTAGTGASETSDVTVAGRDYRMITEQRGPATIQGALDLSTNHQERDRLIATLLGAGLIGLGLAAAAGTWLGARAVGPLDEALATQRRFVADASHELRTPLTLLSTRAQMLRRHLNRPETSTRARAEAEAVVSDSAHLAAILEDLLLAADPRTGSAEGTDPVDLVDLVDLVLASCADRAESDGIVLDRGPSPSPDAWTLGSATALRRAVTALVDNALRHAHAHVQVVVTRNRRDLHVEVHDDGPGVDPWIAPHMFDRFATHDAAEPRPAAAPDPGTDTDTDTGPAASRPRSYGIGLALVAGIAEAHGGTVTSVPTPSGSGALLRLTLTSA